MLSGFISRRRASADMTLERYRVLGAVLVLNEFSIAELAVLSGITETGVRVTLRRERGYIELVSGGGESSTARWRLRPDARSSLRVRLRKMENNGVGPWLGVQVDDQAVPAGIIAAQDVLLHRLDRVSDPVERSQLVRLAEAQLRVAAATHPGSPGGIGSASSRLIHQHRRLAQVLLDLERAEHANRSPASGPEFRAFAEDALSIAEDISEESLLNEVRQRVVNILADEGPNAGSDHITSAQDILAAAAPMGGSSAAEWRSLAPAWPALLFLVCIVPCIVLIVWFSPKVLVRREASYAVTPREGHKTGQMRSATYVVSVPVGYSVLLGTSKPILTPFPAGSRADLRVDSTGQFIWPANGVRMTSPRSLRARMPHSCAKSPRELRAASTPGTRLCLLLGNKIAGVTVAPSGSAEPSTVTLQVTIWPGR